MKKVTPRKKKEVSSPKENPLFTIIGKITNDKKRDTSPEFRSFIAGEYVPFAINQFLGSSQDCIHYVNEMNKYPFLDRYAQYSFLQNTIRKMRRNVKWPRPTKNLRIDTIAKYYGYNRNKAAQVESIFTDEQISSMEQKMGEGGNSK